MVINDKHSHLVFLILTPHFRLTALAAFEQDAFFAAKTLPHLVSDDHFNSVIIFITILTLYDHYISFDIPFLKNSEFNIFSMFYWTVSINVFRSPGFNSIHKLLSSQELFV